MYLFLVWSAVIVSTLYLYYRQQYSSFTRYGVKTLPTLPIFGNMATIITRTEHLANYINRLYFGFSEERFVGRYEFLRPIFTVRDTELIKNIVVKDFEYFVDHRTLLDDQNDPLFGRNLLFLKGQEWKNMRATLSPAFTSAKIRNMAPFIVEVAEQVVEYVKKNIDESGVQHTDLDVKDLTGRLANDVIATCAFGLKVDSHQDPNNLFYNMGKQALGFTLRSLVIIIGYSSFPQIMKGLKVTVFPDSVKGFFRKLVISTMKNREQNHIIRPDMIHLLMEAKKGKLTAEDQSAETNDGFAMVEESAVGKKVVNTVWKDDDLVAQAILFFIAGFETISRTLSFFLHEVALNPDVQDRLVQEIKETHAKNGGKFDYNCIQQMTYLDMVLSETLRKWPAVVALDRVCAKDYNCGKPNSKATQDFVLRKGTTVSIPVWAIHNDPEYFPNPRKFDPERFADENKHNIKPFTYMPFGMGPRNCIGSRFALAEVKTVIYHLLKDLEISPCEKTNTTGQISPRVYNITLDGGFWLRFKNRVEIVDK